MESDCPFVRYSVKYMTNCKKSFLHKFLCGPELLNVELTNSTEVLFSFIRHHFVVGSRELSLNELHLRF